MNYKIAQVIGLNTDQTAAQVISSIRDENNLFLAVLQLTCDDAFTKGRQVLNDLVDFYFEKEGNTGSKLTETFQEFKKKVGQEEYDVALVAVSGKALYMIYQGGVAAFLTREQSLNSLNSVGLPEQIISGFLQKGDRVFFSSSSLAALLGDDLKSNLQVPFASWEEEINTKINTQEEYQGLAGLILDVEPQEQGEEAGLSNENSLVARSETIAQKIFSHLLAVKQIFSRKDDDGSQPLWEIKQGQSKKAVIKLILGVSLILVLSFGIGLQYKKNKDAKMQVEFQGHLETAKNEFASAQSLKTINPTEARQKLDSAVSSLNQALSLKPNDTSAQDLQKNLTQAKNDILQQFSASNINLFLDLNLIKNDLKVANLSVSDGKLLLLDVSSPTLVLIDLAKKSHQVLAGKEQLGNGLHASLNGDFAFIYSQDKGVIKLDATNKKTISVSKADKDLGEIVGIYGFASNIYLLDKGNPPAGGQIWKYLPTAAGYSDKREYLLKDVKADFSNAARMQIESSIYVMKKGGEILRFTKGNSDFFSLSGLDKGIKDPKSFFVSSETDNLYILDSGNSRLLSVDKKGVYKSQYQGDKFASALDLVVDEKGKKVYLLEGSKIYSMDLK